MTSDPRGILLNFEDPQRQVIAAVSVDIPVYDYIHGINQNYAYVNSNPLKYIDPTGEILNILLLVAAVLGGFYCYKEGLNSCEESYPNHKNLAHPDYRLYLQCIAGVTEVVGRGVGMGSEPIGTAAGAAGETASCSINDECL